LIGAPGEAKFSPGVRLTADFLGRRRNVRNVNVLPRVGGKPVNALIIKEKKMQQVPSVTFKTRVRNDSLGGPNPFEWKDLSTDEIFKGKKVVVFALPGAFTPTCSSNHLPRYEELYDEFTKLGVDRIVCLSVNDAFVMYQWGKVQGAKNIFLLPDGNGEFTRKMGMLVDKSNLGFGMRSWRYSMYVVDGKVEKMFVEDGYSDNCPADPFQVSDADTMLGYLKAQVGSKAA
jgi:peroxiredoxin